MDDVTDAIIQRVIRRKFASQTIIAIAHKLDSILDFDRVAVLDHGQLVEFDDPNELLARPSSSFAQLYNGPDSEPADGNANADAETLAGESDAAE